MQSAESIDFSSSNLDGNITKLFQRLPQCYPNKLKEMHLRDNKFSGVLPNWIGRWTSLVTLDLSYNQLTGPMPSAIGTLNNLINLDLSGNNIDGVITHEHFANQVKVY
jgi:Leucine-rich repeat (LRR) protein